MYIQGIIINNSVCERTINWIIQTKEKRNIIFTYTHEDIIFILNLSNLTSVNQKCQINNLLNIKNKNFKITTWKICNVEKLK